MIVVAIIGILAAVAIPAYQDYTIRAKVTEGFGYAATGKTAVSEYYISNATMPTSAQLGLSSPSTPFVQDLTITRVSSTVATIQVLYNAIGGTVTGAPGDSVLEFTGTGGPSGVAWVCNTAGNTIDAKYRPSICR